MNLRELRESHYLTQAEVAASVGVAVTTVSNWERGEQQPSFPNIRKLAELFKTTPQAIDKAIADTAAGK